MLLLSSFFIMIMTIITVHFLTIILESIHSYEIKTCNFSLLKNHSWVKTTMILGGIKGN